MNRIIEFFARYIFRDFNFLSNDKDFYGKFIGYSFINAECNGRFFRFKNVAFIRRGRIYYSKNKFLLEYPFKKGEKYFIKKPQKS